MGLEEELETSWSCVGQCGLTSLSMPAPTSLSLEGGEGQGTHLVDRVRAGLAAWRSSVRPRRIVPGNI